MRTIKFTLHLVLWLVYTVAAWAQAPGATVGSKQGRTLFANSKQFIPQDRFEGWYNEVLASCRRMHDCQAKPAADFIDIVWYAYNGAIPCGPDAKCDGQALVGVNLIFLSPRAMYDQRVIKHEMLHLILGTGEHPQVFAYLNLGRE